MMNETGAHCKQNHMNHSSLGICFVGNYNHRPPPDEMLELGAKLVRSLIRVFNIPVFNVFGHRDFAAYKTCPGRMFDMGLFRDKLN